MEFSAQQRIALAEVSKWLETPNGSPDKKQVFKLFGYAGTGKTTLIKHLIGDWLKDCCFAAYTGKAALVMQKQGLPDASTIHSLIYKFVPPSRKAITELQEKIKTAPKTEHSRLNKELRELNRPRFVLADTQDTPLSRARLCVLDECSMVNEELANDLLSYKVPTLVLGDPGQLPPIDGAGYFNRGAPSVMLTEIHRQAKDNPIIDLATRARMGNTLPIGDFGDSVVKLKFTEDDLLLADQIITGKNATRMKLNQQLRRMKGFSGALPQPGERLICLKNQRDRGLLNGLQAEVLEIIEVGFDTFSMKIKTELGEELEVQALTAFFNEYNTPGTVKKLTFYDRKDKSEFDFGYAITVHKSQGSQWDNVLFWDDKFLVWDRQERARWLYTGVTRAAKRISIIKM